MAAVELSSGLPPGVLGGQLTQGAANGVRFVSRVTKAATLTNKEVKAAQVASKIHWVDENVGLKGLAKEYNDSAIGARSNPLTKTGQAPALERTLEDGTKSLVKFDGVDGTVMIDRKVSIVTTQKAKDQALRQSDALRQNGLTGRWEVPNAAQQTRAENMLDKLNIDNISVTVETPQ
jgi:filamentous hemagglutinin